MSLWGWGFGVFFDALLVGTLQTNILVSSSFPLKDRPSVSAQMGGTRSSI